MNVLNLVPQQFLNFLEDLAKIAPLQRIGIGAPEIHQFLSQCRTFERGASNRLHVLLLNFRERFATTQEFATTQDPGQAIVEIVRHPGGHLAHALHVLRPLQHTLCFTISILSLLAVPHHRVDQQDHEK